MAEFWQTAAVVVFGLGCCGFAWLMWFVMFREFDWHG